MRQLHEARPPNGVAEAPDDWSFLDEEPLPETRHLDPGMRGWTRIWAVIEETFGDFNCEHPVSHEAWQYMGSSRRVPERWRHGFRHRDLPSVDDPRADGIRTYCSVFGDDDDFDPERSVR